MSTKEIKEGQFIGPVKIVSFEKLDYTTLKDQAVYRVECDDKRTRILSEVQLITSVTDKRSDWSSLRERRMLPVAQEILHLMLEHNVSVGDMEHLFMTVGKSVDESFNRAASILWHGDSTYYAPGSETNGDERVFIQADMILKSKEDGGKEDNAS